MNFHFFEFFGCQLSGFREDMLRDGKFADVMQQGGGAQSLELVSAQPHLLGKFSAVNPHTLEVIVRTVVFCFNGERQGFDGSKVEGRHLVDVPLFTLQAVEVQAIRTINPVNNRKEKQGRLPADDAIQAADGTRDCGPYEIVREGPKVTFLPSVLDPLSFGEGNYGCHWNRIHHEESQRS